MLTALFLGLWISEVATTVDGVIIGIAWAILEIAIQAVRKQQ